MKHILILLFISLSINLNAQQLSRKEKNAAPVIDSSLYIKGKKQYKTGLILMTFGGTAMVLGTIIYAGASSDGGQTAGIATLAAGGAMTIASIPFLIAGGKKKKKSRMATTAFSVQPLKTPGQPKNLYSGGIVINL